MEDFALVLLILYALSPTQRHIFTAWFVATGLGTPILLGLNATPATTEETQTEVSQSVPPKSISVHLALSESTDIVFKYSY